MTKKLKQSCIFDQNSKNHNWEHLEKYIYDENFCVLDLMAICVAKFSLQPAVRSNNVKSDSTELFLNGDFYKVTIEKLDK